MKVKAMVILVYMAPRAQSCQRKKTGDCVRGTRTGIRTTTSRRIPKRRGITPTSKKTATLAFAP